MKSKILNKEFTDSHGNTIRVSHTFCTIDRCHKLIVRQGKDTIDLTQELLDQLVNNFYPINVSNLPLAEGEILFSDKDYEEK